MDPQEVIGTAKHDVRFGHSQNQAKNCYFKYNNVRTPLPLSRFSSRRLTIIPLLRFLCRSPSRLATTSNSRTQFYKCMAEQDDNLDACKTKMRDFKSICPDMWWQAWDEQR